MSHRIRIAFRTRQPTMMRLPLGLFVVCFLQVVVLTASKIQLRTTGGGLKTKMLFNPAPSVADVTKLMHLDETIKLNWYFTTVAGVKKQQDLYRNMKDKALTFDGITVILKNPGSDKSGMGPRLLFSNQAEDKKIKGGEIDLGSTTNLALVKNSGKIVRHMPSLNVRIDVQLDKEPEVRNSWLEVYVNYDYNPRITIPIEPDLILLHSGDKSQTIQQLIAKIWNPKK